MRAMQAILHTIMQQQQLQALQATIPVVQQLLVPLTSSRMWMHLRPLQLQGMVQQQVQQLVMLQRMRMHHPPGLQKLEQPMSQQGLLQGPQSQGPS